MISLLSTNDLGDFGKPNDKQLTYASFPKLSPLTNVELVVSGKVLAIIANEDQVP